MTLHNIGFGGGRFTLWPRAPTSAHSQRFGQYRYVVDQQLLASGVVDDEGRLIGLRRGCARPDRQCWRIQAVRRLWSRFGAHLR